MSTPGTLLSIVSLKIVIVYRKIELFLQAPRLFRAKSRRERTEPDGTEVCMAWTNREYFCNLYVGINLVGQISRGHNAQKGWFGVLLDNGQIIQRVGCFEEAEEARTNVVATVVAGTADARLAGRSQSGERYI
jgi:hypothetical protein